MQLVKGINFAGTFLILILITGLLMLSLNIPFIDLSLFVGITSIVLVRLFTSPSNYAKVNRSFTTSSSDTVQLGEQKEYIFPRAILNACYSFTFIFLVIVFISYYDYFVS